jgi:hypothetical protein
MRALVCILFDLDHFDDRLLGRINGLPRALKAVRGRKTFNKRDGEAKAKRPDERLGCA